MEPRDCRGRENEGEARTEGSRDLGREKDGRIVSERKGKLYKD